MSNLSILTDVFPKKCMLTGLRIELSYHHIIKVENRGPKTVENGGLLYTGVHQWLHNDAERNHYSLYEETNKRIRDYKRLFLEHPEMLKEWEDYMNECYLNKCIEYYYRNHDIGKVKMLRREYENRFKVR